ncbi:hypothetical protein ANMWB30_11600 [Arthrobacter sp. MWB30]|jgi:hypothetical protein|nr:hypothetical protein ANMWB30_11600 [Arthrobacter sp. MWB30]
MLAGLSLLLAYGEAPLSHSGLRALSTACHESELMPPSFGFGSR